MKRGKGGKKGWTLIHTHTLSHAHIQASTPLHTYTHAQRHAVNKGEKGGEGSKGVKQNKTIRKEGRRKEG